MCRLLRHILIALVFTYLILPFVEGISAQEYTYYTVYDGSVKNELIIDVINVCSGCGITDAVVTAVSFPDFVYNFYPESVMIPDVIPKGERGTAVFTFDVMAVAPPGRVPSDMPAQITGNIELEIMAATGDMMTTSIPLVVSPQTVLSVEDGYGIPGKTGQVNVSIVNTQSLETVDVSIIDNPDFLTAIDFQKTSRTGGFTPFLTDSLGAEIGLYGFGSYISPGEGSIGRVLYAINSEAPFGDSLWMQLSVPIIVDSLGQEVAVGLVSGTFLLGKRGDVDGNEGINVLDVLMAANIILEIHVPNEYELWAADCNEDGVINVLDLVGIVRVILGLGTCPPTLPLSKGIAAQAEVNVSSPIVQTRKELLIPIDLNSSEAVAGFQVRLSYDASKLVPADPEGTVRSAHMTLASHTQYGEVVILVYSSRGDVIGAGSGPLVTVPFEVVGGAQGDAGLQFEEIILAGVGAVPLPVEAPYPEISLNVGLPVPEVYSIAQNYPNPFNLQTIIRYQLPKAGWVNLKIYNILGQEVRTLTDEQEEAGYYTVRWDGRDNSGLEVASGLYFYRIQAGEFAKTAKMLVLK